MRLIFIFIILFKRLEDVFINTWCEFKLNVLDENTQNSQTLQLALFYFILYHATIINQDQTISVGEECVYMFL